MPAIVMKTSSQTAFLLGVLGAVMPAPATLVELFRLADVNLRWHPEEAARALISAMAHLKTRQAITEVSMAVLESLDGINWYRGQIVAPSATGCDLYDGLFKRVVTTDGERWSFTYETNTPYNCIACWASAGAPANSEFEAHVKISKSL